MNLLLKILNAFPSSFQQLSLSLRDTYPVGSRIIGTLDKNEKEIHCER